jgi:phosphotransferase system enzyme I (PtsI)
MSEHEGRPGRADEATAEGGRSEETRASAALVLRGATVAPGLVLGTVHRKDYDLSHAPTQRVALDEVDRELNRFRKALDDSRHQLVDLKSRLTGRVPENDARILDTHVTYLKDSVFIADVENLILNEQMRLEAAIAKVVGDFDRIFRLVKSDTLRQSAVDLRDVGIRVLRNLQRDGPVDVGTEPSASASLPKGDYILVAKELSIVDMFNLANERVKGIVAKEGGLTSHAAIFARSMRIPTLTGVEDLLEKVREGDFVILDATEGILRVRPDEVVRAQYAQAASGEAAAAESAAGETPAWALRPPRTRDGESLDVTAIAGNLPEAEQAAEFGLKAIGLYRTELLFLVDAALPSRDALVQHYAAVVRAARGGAVTFRLLNADSSLAIPYLFRETERNPALGSAGVRALLANEGVLRRQLTALLLAAAECDLGIALPFVLDCGELRRVKEVLFEERFELRKRGETFHDAPRVGVVIETPAAMLGIRDLAREADFLLVNLDSLQQYLLAIDRENPAYAAAFESLHPYVLRALVKSCEVAEHEGRALSVFGVSACAEHNLGLLLGAGVRRFCVPPSGLRAFLDQVSQIDLKQAVRRTRSAAKSACLEEAQSAVALYHHGQARA